MRLAIEIRRNGASPSPINDNTDIAFVIQEDVPAMQILVLDDKRVTTLPDSGH